MIKSVEVSIFDKERQTEKVEMSLNDFLNNPLHIGFYDIKINGKNELDLILDFIQKGWEEKGLHYEATYVSKPLENNQCVE
jgi:hypothetical protein